MGVGVDIRTASSRDPVPLHRIVSDLSSNIDVAARRAGSINGASDVDVVSERGKGPGRGRLRYIVGISGLSPSPVRVQYGVSVLFGFSSEPPPAPPPPPAEKRLFEDYYDGSCSLN